MHSTARKPPATASPRSPPTSCTPLARFVDLAVRDRTSRTAAPPWSKATATPLTHHEIVELVEPFTRGGHALDLAASDRRQRTLMFRSTQRGSAPSSASDAQSCAVRETLQLDSPRPGYFRLTRTLCDDGGMQGCLQAEGARPGDLLRQVQAVPPHHHFQSGPGYRLASSGCVDAKAAANASDASGAAAGQVAGFQITHAVLKTGALTLSLNVASSRSARVSSAAVEIRMDGPGVALPADLLAVLGWDWSLLQRGAHAWQGSVRLRGRARSRGDDAQHKLHLAAAHLTRSLAEAPPRFHERQQPARWWVLARHAIPVLVCGMLACAALFADVLRDARASPLTLGLMCIPPALLLLFLLRSEGARLTLPTWPRASAAKAWGDGR